jgi:putative redox protein
MQVKARVKFVDGMTFVGESGSGHAVVMDGAPEYGGRNIGIRPMEMLLIGLGGCTAFDVVQILRRGREQVTDCEVEVTAERAETDPKVFTGIHIDYRVSGRDLAPAKVERAIQLSKEKYCSASIMLGAVATITHSWAVVDERAQQPGGDA